MGTRLSKESEGLLLQYIRLKLKMFRGRSDGGRSKQGPTSSLSELKYSKASSAQRRGTPLTHVRYQYLRNMPDTPSKFAVYRQAIRRPPHLIQGFC